MPVVPGSPKFAGTGVEQPGRTPFLLMLAIYTPSPVAANGRQAAQSMAVIGAMRRLEKQRNCDARSAVGACREIALQRAVKGRPPRARRPQRPELRRAWRGDRRYADGGPATKASGLPNPRSPARAASMPNSAAACVIAGGEGREVSVPDRAWGLRIFAAAMIRENQTATWPSDASAWSRPW